ncbi:hypothetical protein HJFPF1_00902 [Paramyrothecium foliicola]|nr:hypothetical protein HJFPF1_00902 [Paramyrothecium foliicola]
MDQQPYRHSSPDILSEFRVQDDPHQSQPASDQAFNANPRPSWTCEIDLERLRHISTAPAATSTNSTGRHDGHSADIDQNPRLEFNHPTLFDRMRRNEPINYPLIGHQVRPPNGSAHVHHATEPRSHAESSVGLRELCAPLPSPPRLNKSALLFAVGTWDQARASDVWQIRIEAHSGRPPRSLGDWQQGKQGFTGRANVLQDFSAPRAQVCIPGVDMVPQPIGSPSHTLGDDQGGCRVVVRQDSNHTSSFGVFKPAEAGGESP